MTALAGQHDGGGPLAEAAELINRLLDDELMPGDASRLEQLVCARPDVRRFYVLNLHLWCTLAPHFTSSLAAPEMPAPGVSVPKGAPVIPFPGNRPARVAPAGRTDIPRVNPRPTPAPPSERPAPGQQDLSDMEIPTFIRRQMD